MKTLILITCVIVVMVTSESDEWVWKDDSQRSRSDKTRYQVNENLENLDNEGSLVGFRPQNTGPYGPESRPIVPEYQGNKGVLVGPGGPTGVIKRPHYPSNPHVDEGISNSGFLPPWIKDDPRYREYDTCRCRYSFNCPSTGLKFGTCSKDKRYCCFNSRKYPTLVPGQFAEGHRPSYPGSPPKYGPVGFQPPSNYYGNRRPQGTFHSGNRNPNGNFHLSGDNVNRYPRPPGNPYDQDYDYDSSPDEGPNDFNLYARSSNKNHTNADAKIAET